MSTRLSDRARSASLLAVGLVSFGVMGGSTACGGAERASSGRGASLSPVRYELALDGTLERLTETVCSEGPWTDRLVSIHAEARTRLVTARVVHADGAEAPIDVGASGPLTMSTRGLAPDDCVRVVLDLGSSGGTSGCMRTSDVVVCATSAFVLAAEPWRTTARHRVHVALPEGASMSLIFGEDERGLYLDERAHRYVGYAAFGALERREIPVPGGCTTIVLPARSSLGESPHLVPWVERAGRASAMITGVATGRDATITAVPMPVEGAVLFGMAGRGTRHSVLALVAEQPSPSLETDWTLVHELAHLATPYVPSEDAWLSEGIATYYQEVLRARAGMQSGEDAWRAIDEGLRRGARDGTGSTLREESRGMHASRAYGRVYWGGAAIVLLVDVALRTRGLGTLDDRIARVADAHDTTLTADALLAALDDDDGFVREVAARSLDATTFPDVAEAYAALGLARGEDGTLRFEGDPTLREAIMNPLAAIASNGSCP